MTGSLALCALLVAMPAIGFADEAGGAHAMDFDFGCWKTHSSRLMHPLTGSTEWKDMDGYTVVKPIWNGSANIAEYKGAGPAGEVELLALRTYDPTTQQWYLNFSHPSSGKLDVPGVGVTKWEVNWMNHYTRVRTIGGQTAYPDSALRCGLL